MSAEDLSIHPICVMLILSLGAVGAQVVKAQVLLVIPVESGDKVGDTLDWVPELLC